MKTYRLIVSGNVQGVNYRTSAKNQGLLLRLTGTVRNLDSGDVEAIVSGDPEQLHAFIEWARQGPALASVTNVMAEEFPPTAFTEFSIMR